MIMTGGTKLMLYLHCGVSLVLCFSAHMSLHEKRMYHPVEDDNDDNGTSLFDLLKGNPLHEVSGYWVFNESDISKYEDVDLSKLFQLPGMKGNAIETPTSKPSRPTTKRPPTTTLAPTTPGTQLPVFDTNVVTNVSAPLGGTAFLHCRVRYLTARTVSWVRRRDWHILSAGLMTYTNDDRFTVLHADNSEVSWVRRRDWHILSAGLMTYTNDDRFTVLHADNSEDWHLQIKFVQKRDNGTYECQVSTGVGTISHYYNLHVVTPYAYIEGNGEYHIGEGSTISLLCIVENSPSPPQYVFWYHNDRMINYDTGRNDVTVSTEVTGENTRSTVTVTHATSADTGNYTCRAPNTAHDTIYVFVSKEGDNTAAIQRLETSSSGVHSATLITICLVLHCVFL